MTTNDNNTDATEQIEALRYNLKKIIEENQGEGSMQVHRDPRTIRRASDCLEILEELGQSLQTEQNRRD